MRYIRQLSLMGGLIFFYAILYAADLPSDQRVLTLETAEKIALTNNLTLQVAEQRIKQARERVKQALAAYWPLLDLTAQISSVRVSNDVKQQTLSSARFFDPEASFDQTELYYRVSPQATWIVFDGFARQYAVASARFSTEESLAARNEAKRLLMASVVALYYQSLLARESILITKADKSFYDRQKKEARIRHRVGTGSLSDLLNFKVLSNAAAADLLKRQNDYQIALIALTQIMGLDESITPQDLTLADLPNETNADLAPVDETIQIEYALAHRPDLAQSEMGLKTAEAEVQRAEADRLPSVGLFGSIDGERKDTPKFDGDNFSHTIGLNLSYALFDGGLKKARIAQNRSQMQAANSQFHYLKTQVIAEVRKALAALHTTQQQLILQRKNATLVKQNRDLVAKAYLAGQTSFVHLNEAQRNLTTARGRLAVARVSLKNALKNLDIMTGRCLRGQ